MDAAPMADDPLRTRNRRTALILLSLVLVFFVGVFVRYWLLGR